MNGKQYHPRFPSGVKNLNRAPYRDQVLTHLVISGCGDQLSEQEEAKIVRVARFLSARQCADEIKEARGL